VQRHLAYEAIPTAIDRLDEPLALPAIANGLAYRPHRAFQGGLTDELIGPHLRTQFVFGDHPLTMFQQI
jgi:hypothetical protein